MNCKWIHNLILGYGAVLGIYSTSTRADSEAVVKAIDARSEIQIIQQKLKEKTPLTWVVTGDSITHGAAAPHGWRSYSEHFAEIVRWELFRGTNDVIGGEKGREVFQKHLVEIVDRIRALGAVPVLNIPITICKGISKGTREDLQNFVQIMRDMAVEKNVIFVDHWSYWKEKKNTEETLMNWLSDGLHPNESEGLGV